MWEALASLGGGLAASAMNVYMNKENNEWKERMANTAHQREVKDLRAAGLNPILAANGSGAPVPNLTPGVVENPVPGALEAGFSAKRVSMEAELNKAAVQKTRWDAAAAAQSIEESKARIQLMGDQALAARASAGQMDRTKPWDQLLMEVVRPILNMIGNIKNADAGTLSDQIDGAMRKLGVAPSMESTVKELVKSEFDKTVGTRDKAEMAREAYDKARRKREGLDLPYVIESWTDRPGQGFGGANSAKHNYKVEGVR